MNPIRTKTGGYHCTKVSPGCLNCYAEKFNFRIGDKIPYDNRGVEFVINEKVLYYPFSRKKPTIYFVQSMGDLFHEQMDYNDIAKVFFMMQNCSHHIFQVLTKRPQNAIKFFNWVRQENNLEKVVLKDNIWMGVTAENQKTADERVSILCSIPGIRRFVSCEPLLEKVNLEKYLNPYPKVENKMTLLLQKQLRRTKYLPQIDWVIVGGESGPKARLMLPDWVRSIRDQCIEYDIPFFFKQWGEWLSLDETTTIGQINKMTGKCQIERVDSNYIYKIGKKLAGRELDRQIWDQRPF